MGGDAASEAFVTGCIEELIWQEHGHDATSFNNAEGFFDEEGADIDGLGVERGISFNFFGHLIEAFKRLLF